MNKKTLFLALNKGKEFFVTLFYGLWHLLLTSILILFEKFSIIRFDSLLQR